MGDGTWETFRYGVREDYRTAQGNVYGGREVPAVETVRLLWRHELPATPRLGRPPRLSLDTVIDAGIGIADEAGSPDFSLRAVSDRLGVAVMTLYSYIDSKEQLLDLMVDQCRATMEFGPLTGPWRRRLGQVAGENLALFLAHPWLAHLESERTILGPGTLAKYERELAAVEPLPLDDPGKDAALTLVLDFVRGAARAQVAAAAERGQETPEQWWRREGELLAGLGVAGRFPLAERIGTAAGETNRAAHPAGEAYRFGLAVILDGLERHKGEVRPAARRPGRRRSPG